MGRRTKLTPDREAAIMEGLRRGLPRSTVCGLVEIDEKQFYRWWDRFASFRQSAIRAEAESEKRFAGVIELAAAPHDVQTRQTTTRTVFKTKRTRHKDGTVVEEPVALTETSETVSVTRDSDWRAAESWLKRRRRAEWGDSIDVRKLDDDTLLRLIAAAAGSETAGSADTRSGEA